MSVIRQRNKNLIGAFCVGLLVASTILSAVALAKPEVVTTLSEKIGVSSLGTKGTEEVDPMTVKGDVLVFIQPFEAGHQIERGDLMKIAMPTIYIPEQNIIQVEEAVGKTLKVAVGARMPMTTGMLSAYEQVPDDLRLNEFGIFSIPMKLEKADFVDVRIKFATGEDYVVLSKKKVLDIDRVNTRLWMALDEKELLTMSSALIDLIFQEGAALYLLEYVEPDLQKSAEVTYPVNSAVINLMKSQPALAADISKALIGSGRENLEARLKSLNIESATDLESVLQNGAVNDSTMVLTGGTTDLTGDSVTSEVNSVEDGSTTDSSGGATGNTSGATGNTSGVPKTATTEVPASVPEVQSTKEVVPAPKTETTNQSSTPAVTF